MTVLVKLTLLSLIGCSLVFYALCARIPRRFFAAERRDRPATSLPASVLIPVCGLDGGALENWESFCQQDHAHYEVLFGVMDADDPAVSVLQGLAAKYPDRARLMAGLSPLGINHQISNLMHLLAVARHEIVVLADSDIRVSPSYLRTVTAPLSNPSIGVVTCVYLDRHPKSLGAALASLGQAIQAIPSVLIARRLDGGMRFAIGPTIATRRSVLADIGGLEAVANRIGSDYHIGNLAAYAGYRVELSPYVLHNDCGFETVLGVFRRELRWARTIRCNRGLQYYGQVATYGTIFSFLLMLIANFSVWSVVVCLVVMALRFTQAVSNIRSLNCPALRRWLWALPLRDFMSVAVWIGGAYGYRVHWRGRYLKIGAEGALIEVEQP